MHLVDPVTLSLNLPENPTIADVIAALQRCDPTRHAYDEVYRPLTAVVIDSNGDVVFSALPRIKPRPTISAMPAAELLDECRS